MSVHPPLDRWALGRALTQLSTGRAAEVPEPAPDAAPARRIGVTGAPGAGKSSLVGRLALQRLRARRVGVLAIDPSSPRSGGAILGDRIRIDEIDEAGELYVRSIASRSATDGLSDLAPEMLAAMEAFGFDELVLETVGVGQVEQAVRRIVDTLVLVIPPDGGDHVQAMKAGIAELADIVVVHKADLPAAQRMAADLRRVLALSRRAPQAWVPPVLLTSVRDAASVQALSQAIDEHQAWLARSDAGPALRLERARYALARALERLARRVADEQDTGFFLQPAQLQLRQAALLIARHAGAEDRPPQPQKNHQETSP
ncbi:MAG: GTP-binding protein [Rubrivivax sp.]